MIGEGSQLANDFWILLAMVIYFAAMLSIGFIYSKRSNSSSKEYFAGGRGVGPWLTALSAEASDMSGWLLMGLPGLAYFTGAADPMWTAIGLALGTYLNWKLVARRLRRYSVVTDDAITIPDFFAKRFHDKKGVISTIAAVIILVFFSVYVGSCFVTVGKLFATLFGFDYHVMMIIGAVVVFVYTVVGGYLSVVMTDFIQGMLMFFALAVVFIGTVASAGGVDNTVEFLRAIPGYLSGTQVAAPKLDPAPASSSSRRARPCSARPPTTASSPSSPCWRGAWVTSVCRRCWCASCPSAAWKKCASPESSPPPGA